MVLSEKKRKELEDMISSRSLCRKWKRQSSPTEDAEKAELREEIRRYEEEKKIGSIWDELAESVESARKTEINNAYIERKTEKQDSSA